MPLLDEVLAYIRGLWLLAQGNEEGFRWLDFSESGLWRSFTSMLWCLPAIAVTWASWRLYYLSVMPDGTTIGIGFIFKLLVVDLVSWLLPLVLIAVLSRPLGFAGAVVPIVVTTNWLSVPLSYAMAVPAAIRVVIPGSQGLTSFIWLTLLVISVAVLFRLLRMVTGNQTLLASALTALFLLPSMMIGDLLQRFFGLIPTS
ncbi:hypothetical protein ACI2KT_03940 [Ensifer adhaerens]|jgi:hypothetical protein|uniref:Yip1 domain-containing protein n=1 Tax=Ensifer adhaerens TaxID=106592 RepID=A0A9Q9DA03_ENSAD|nr:MULTISPECIES: hypothetical protein [Ensifer]MBD9593080.1 hypothetical protein [Ensifer sp. ENS05]MBD9637953.1 hypothetical protein [Ensifer sp. ENS07]USJ23471.1 hypothetical protein NE863_00305 [Ensifer adhaerens]UTV36798.1 hypothetical protein MYG64_00305 [Ensifer adhaerens]SDL78051.1 hypothetical protein SAMN05216328_103448 [Ensifer sp. YR511]